MIKMELEQNSLNVLENFELWPSCSLAVAKLPHKTFKWNKSVWKGRYPQVAGPLEEFTIGEVVFALKEIDEN